MGDPNTKQPCANSYTSKAANAVTRSVPSSGRSSQMNTVLTLPVPTTVTPTFSWSASTCTTTRPLAVATCLVPSLWTLSQVPWTPSVPAHSVSFSAQTTLSSVRLAPVTTGPRVTTPRVLSLSTQFSMLSVRRPNLAIASRASS